MARLHTFQLGSWRSFAFRVAVSIHTMPVLPAITRVLPSGLTAAALPPNSLAATSLMPGTDADCALLSLAARGALGTPPSTPMSVTIPVAPLVAYRCVPAAFRASDQRNPSVLGALRGRAMQNAIGFSRLSAWMNAVPLERT